MTSTYYYSLSYPGPNAYTVTTELNDQSTTTGYHIQNPLGSLTVSGITVEIDLGSSALAITSASIYVEWANTLEYSVKYSTDNSTWFPCVLQFISFPSSISHNGVFEGGWVTFTFQSPIYAEYFSIAVADNNPTSTSPSHINVTEAYVSDSSGPAGYYPTTTVYTLTDSANGGYVPYLTASSLSLTDITFHSEISFTNTPATSDTLAAAFNFGEPTGIASITYELQEIVEVISTMVGVVNQAEFSYTSLVYVYTPEVLDTIFSPEFTNSVVAPVIVSDSSSSAATFAVIPSAAIDSASADFSSMEVSTQANTKLIVTQGSAASVLLMELYPQVVLDIGTGVNKLNFNTLPKVSETITALSPLSKSLITAYIIEKHTILEGFSPPLIKILVESFVATSHSLISYQSSDVNNMFVAVEDIATSSLSTATASAVISEAVEAYYNYGNASGLSVNADYISANEAANTGSAQKIFACLEVLIGTSVTSVPKVTFGVNDSASNSKTQSMSLILNIVDSVVGIVPAKYTTRVVRDQAASTYVLNAISVPTLIVSMSNLRSFSLSATPISTSETYTSSIIDFPITATSKGSVTGSTSSTIYSTPILTGVFLPIPTLEINATAEQVSGAATFIPSYYNTSNPPPPPPVQILAMTNDTIIGESNNVQPVSLIDYASSTNLLSYNILGGAATIGKGLYINTIDSKGDVMVGPVQIIIYEDQ